MALTDTTHAPTAAGTAPPSALRIINDASRRLEILLFALAGKCDVQNDVQQIAAQLDKVVFDAPDLALASILLGQIAATYSVRHCVETALLAIVVARRLGKPDAEVLTVACAALTMNAGMLGYHEQYQSKRIELSPEEMQTIHRHPQEGVHLLSRAGVTNHDWLTYVLQHHENTDGSGYPAGSFDVAPNAILVSMADRYCAAVSARNYRRSQLPDLALRDLFLDRRAGRDTHLAACFASQLGPYPPGTRVRLDNGDVGVVTRRGFDGAPPKVLALADGNGDAYPAPQWRDGAQIACALHEDQADIRFSMKQLWGEQAAL